jgi:deoxyribonuclease IV
VTGPANDLGAHVSIAGGLERALERAQALACGCAQIFLRNHRQWAARPLGADEIAAFARARRRTEIGPVFAHANYLVNLAAPAAEHWRRSVDAVTDELERAEALGLTCLVIHPGSHRGEGLETGIRRIVRALDEVTGRTAGARVKIALENTAGAGDTVGRTFGDLGALVSRVRRPERLGVCIDTCHLFVAGYDMRTAPGYRQAMAECEETVGFARLLAVHLNDARAGLGSGLDRHANIGAGLLGLEPFRLLLNDRRFAGIPKVIETPKEPEPEADRRNLATLRGLVGALSARTARRRAGTRP